MKKYTAICFMTLLFLSVTCSAEIYISDGHGGFFFPDGTHIIDDGNNGFYPESTSLSG